MVKAIAAISCVYDVLAGVTLLLFRGVLPAWFGLPIPEPPVHLDLNGIFLVALGFGYLLPYREPVRYRAYLWVFGVALKTAGALAFLVDYAVRASPASTLLFAASDAAMAALTLMALMRSRANVVRG